MEVVEQGERTVTVIASKRKEKKSPERTKI